MRIKRWKGRGKGRKDMKEEKSNKGWRIENKEERQTDDWREGKARGKMKDRRKYIQYIYIYKMNPAFCSVSNLLKLFLNIDFAL